MSLNHHDPEAPRPLTLRDAGPGDGPDLGVDLPMLLGTMVSELFDGVAPLVLAPSEEGTQLLDAELLGAAVAVTSAMLGPEGAHAFGAVLVEQATARADQAALALLRVIASQQAGSLSETGPAAATAADRLVAAGVAEPGWTADLAEPVRLADALRLSDSFGLASALVATFWRAGVGHTVLVTVDEQLCGAASDINLVPHADLAAVLEDLRDAWGVPPTTIRTQLLDPAELHWHLVDALTSRNLLDEATADILDATDGVEHDDLDDASGDGDDLDEDDLDDGDDLDEDDPAWDDDDPDDGRYEALVEILGARMATLPPPVQPAGAHPHHDREPVAAAVPQGAVLQQLMDMVAQLDPTGTGDEALPPGPGPTTGQASIYQVKVSLRGAAPPIWRRLLVPADTRLSMLHHVLQCAFGWADGHLHMFETPLGRFGDTDPDLEILTADRVTLRQVAPGTGAKIRYRYDFGDNWDHEIVVEKLLNREPGRPYPRCTAGRRAAPPEDCGGVWGYQDLIDVLADPQHEEHAHRLEWLGLEDPDDFDPDAFAVEDVNVALSRLR